VPPSHFVVEREMTKAPDPQRRPRIVFYNDFFGSTPDLSRLDAEEREAFSSDRSCYPNADADVFHVPDLFSTSLGRQEVESTNRAGSFGLRGPWKAR
jgi:hypothetical protein